MKYIDMHSHIFPPGVAEKVIDTLENYYHSHWSGTGELDDLLRNLRQAHISRSVIFSSATKPTQVIPINNFVDRIQREYPELLLAFGTLHPDFPDYEREIVRIREMGLHGLKFHPDFQQFRIDAPCMDGIYRAVGDSLPLLNIHKKYPALKLIAAHLGGYSEWDRAWKYLIGTDVWLDISSTIKFIGPEEARRMVRAHGADRVLFASDYPGTNHAQAVADVLSLGLTPEENEKIFYRNAEQLLGITV